MSFVIYNRIEVGEDSLTTPTESEKQTEKRVCRWRKSQPPERYTDFHGHHSQYQMILLEI